MKQDRPLHLSFSAISAFKSCPVRFKNAYLLGIRPIEATDALRIGSNWHRILDVASRKPGSVCTHCAELSKNDPNCPLCAGTGYMPEDIMEAVVGELNSIYDKDYYDKDKMEIERTKLLYSLCGYRWRWQELEEEVLGREEFFELPLINPKSGRALPGVKLVGCIDKFIAWEGRAAIKEHKSTSKSVDSASTYWGHLNLDTQTTLYLYAARRLQIAGELRRFGIKESDPLINTIIYDVYHKPTINPAKLTQADSKKFVESGEYMGQEFFVSSKGDCEKPGEPGFLYVNHVESEIEPGKREGTFSTRETPEMYGARLLHDITERPDFYFALKELTRTDQEMEKFEYELLNIYRTIQHMRKDDNWYCNESNCEATYKCEYIDSCYNGIELSVDNIPDGMKLIFKS